MSTRLLCGIKNPGPPLPLSHLLLPRQELRVGGLGGAADERIVVPFREGGALLVHVADLPTSLSRSVFCETMSETTGWYATVARR